MNRHQVLTGAVNAGDSCFALGSVEGIQFTCYAAGCDIVILASDFQRVQILPGAAHGNIQVTCIDCCSDAGKIAASYGKKVCIFEPTPLLHHDSTHKLDYQWYNTGSIETDSEVHSLSWNQEGSRLLTGGAMVQMWQMPEHPPQEKGVEFFIDDNEELPDWTCVWHCHPASPIVQLRFSHDGMLFASLGKGDRVVKIWYENKKVQLPMSRNDSISPKKEEVNYSFVYIAHPRAVTGFSWRKTSRYMPKGSVANMLITACKDNICRIWMETILPDDGQIDANQLDPQIAIHPVFHTQRHKKRFMERLHHIRHIMHERKRQHHANMPPAVQGVPSLPSTQTVHDFHKFGVHPNSVAPSFHFHLAASINPETDIPLLPVVGPSTSPGGVNFVVHWLNNKELEFTSEAEKILEEMSKRSGAGTSSEDSNTEHGDTQTEGDPDSDQGADHFAGSEQEVNAFPTDKFKVRQKRRYLHTSRKYLSTESEQSTTSHASTVTQSSDSTVVAGSNRSQGDPLDHKIEVLMRQWHQSTDMLFSIHPIDGSFLVWLVEWLDEASPGQFRQSQISFSSRIPRAIPVGDAMTMSSHLLLYCNYGKPDLKSALKDSESKTFDGSEKSSATPPKYSANMMGKSSPGQSDNTLTPNALMISKHSNGSLNLWQISFAEHSSFSTILSIAHASRACGHRFHTNSAACHPVLPLLLTTSHHNVPNIDLNKDDNLHQNHSAQQHTSAAAASGFCSELILWRVDPIGPLSKSGGVSELSRINSPEPSSFSNVAWLPTLLPSSTLGPHCNSPSALFVASDGSSLRIYQAVIDARNLLTEIASTKRHEYLRQRSVSSSVLSPSTSSTSSSWAMNAPSPVPFDKNDINIVSEQSTARPGCIIELDAIRDAKQDWQNLQLIHIYQEQLITGHKSKGQSSNIEALVDLQAASIFQEQFYLVVIERLTSGSGSVLHMWKIVIASSGEAGTKNFSPDVSFFQDGASPDSRENSPVPPCMRDKQQQSQNAPQLSITTAKVCTQMLDLPTGIQVTSATPAAGHLSSSSIYPACFAPYLVSTACSDGRIRFWHCLCEHSSDGKQGQGDCMKYEWKEWEMMIRTEDTSSIKVAGKPLAVNCAYSGRVAVAYRIGGLKTQNDNQESKFVNLCVSIYECESTGGSEWTLEDTIELKNITIQDPKMNIDLSYIYNNETGDVPETIHTSQSQVIMSPTMSTPAIVKTPIPSIPSSATVQSVKKSLTSKESKLALLRQKHLVQLDWVSTEDGSHILTIAVGPKILLYAAVSSELAQASQKDHKASKARPTRGMLQKSKSMTVQTFVEEIRWMKVRSIELLTADGLPPLPMHVSWVRDGILVVGMDNEMQVYSQWKGPGDALDGPSEPVKPLDTRTLTEQSLQTVSSSASLNLSLTKSFKLSPSISSMKLTQSISNMSLLLDKRDKDKRKDLKQSKGELTKSDSISSVQLIQDLGLFEAGRLANPVLPQYHPKQLIELLNFGKIRRVKAILAHLLRCIAGGGGLNHGHEDIQQQRQRMLTRGMTQASSPHEGPSIPEEAAVDYIEISSIPPLPLYALLAADKDPASFTNRETAVGAKQSSNSQDYSTLFHADLGDDLDDPFDSEEVFSTSPQQRERRLSSTQFMSNPNYFGPTQSRLLARHLTHTHLPGLSSLDQMYLLALADTVANTKVDFSEKEAADMAVRSTVAREQGQEHTSTDSIDDCGLRYLLAARHHVYLMNTLPIRQRAQLQKQGLSPAYFVWAFHSEAEEELLSALPNMQKGKPIWAEIRQFGAGWWLRNINSLRRCIEKIAKQAFQTNQDPLDAAIFYLAMKKKNVLWGLFRSVSDTKMVQFFRNNFSEDRWRKAALKNAFALLGRQRFHHAAAFFLLAGALRDAVEVCLNKLDDLQLALVIARLYESELDAGMPPNVKRLLYEECLGCDQNGQNYDPTNVHPDPFIRSMSYVMLKDYSASLGTLLETGLGSARKVENDRGDMGSYSANPSVFNFYNYLRTHPLLVRQHLATTAADKSKTVLLSGFSHGAQVSAGDKNVTYVDRITPLERRLYFTTANAHFKNGCPVLALEVLSKLPDVIDMETDITKSRSADSVCSKSIISTGRLDIDNVSAKDSSADKVNGIDWGAPVSNQTSNGIDWGKSVITSALNNNTADALDWGAPISKPKEDALVLDWGLDDEDDADADETDTKSDSEIESKDKLLKGDSKDQSDEGLTKSEVDEGIGDIMAQQLKFVACLKIMMEELSTLATGFEVDGGQLRYQLYIWLEKEVEVLKQLCNYGQIDEVTNLLSITEGDDEGTIEMTKSTISQRSSYVGQDVDKPTLHEILLAEKMDFDAKLQRMQKRNEWLKMNQHLLRTLLCYSVLHGAGGGGLQSVRMELVLLLQELQQEKPQQQLLSPLPFPTTLPLLSASVASAKTVIADPIRQLQGVTQDILHTIIEFRTPPTFTHSLNKVFVLRNLSAALSSCLYQSLCDSDNFVVSMSDSLDIGMEGFTSTSVVYKDSYLMAGAQRKHHVSTTDNEPPNSQPAKWPGVSNLRALLAREKDEDSPRLNFLLCESLVGVYMSLLIHALAMYDANILYRLVGHTFEERMWPALFGGGLKKLIKTTAAPADMHSRVAKGQDEAAKKRLNFNAKVLGGHPSSQKLKDDKPTYKEKFVPPDVGMLSYFMTKPFEDPEHSGVDYDSAESVSSDEEDEEDEIIGARRNDTAMEEHIDPNSYSWCLMRYAIVKYIHHSLLVFLPQVGMEIPELPVCSPLLHALLKTLEQWEELLRVRLELFQGPPLEYIPGCFVDTLVNGPAILKYKALLDPMNTPFLSSHVSTLPAKRLWHYLVRREFLQDVFIRYIFKKKRPGEEDDSMKSGSGESNAGTFIPTEDPMKIIHKEQDLVAAFCINQYFGDWSSQGKVGTDMENGRARANLNCLALATQKEVVEMDITGILHPPTWLEDEVEYDIETINHPGPNQIQPEEFLVVQAPADKLVLASSNPNLPSHPPTAPGAIPAPTQLTMGQTGRGGSVIKGLSIPGITNPYFSYYIVDRSRRLMRLSIARHPVPAIPGMQQEVTKRQITGVRRMGSHPHLPYYLTGSQDGAVRLWEWGHSQCICVARQPGSFPKVTKVLFNAQGNKLGVCDGEGSVCLWQVGLGVNMNRPYLSLKCHNKSCSDFVFVGSSSLLATAGHSSENRNVCLWDTLLPKRSALVQAFQCHQDGSPSVLYAPQQQVLVSAGKRGDICIFDFRQRQLRHSFQAHEAAVKCLALDPTEHFFISGSADGDVKMWGLAANNLLCSYPGEHAKSSLFRQAGSGVTQVYLSPQDHLFSCGADGSMKVRKLPDRELIVQSYC